MGHGDAEGMAINVALPPHTGDAGWLRAFHAVVPPLVRAFEPEILVTQLGCDTHRLDPLAQLDLTVDAHRHSYAVLHELAHEVAGGRWVAVGRRRLRDRAGRAQVVDPRAGRDRRRAAGPGHRTPPAGAGWSRQRTGQQAPQRLTDGADATYRPWDAGEGDRDDPVDRAIAATRRAVFPEHGLDHLDPR